MSEHDARGRHLLMNGSGIDPAMLRNVDDLDTTMYRAIVATGASVRTTALEHFEPEGLSLVYVLAESHASIHTYPAEGVAFVDFFTCGDVDPEPANTIIAAALGGRWHCTTIHREPPL